MSALGTIPIAQIMLGSDQVWPPDTTGLMLTPDYWIDAVGGNDANAGTSEAAAWKTLSKIGSFALAANTTKVVRVKAGAYADALDYVARSSTVPGGDAGAGAHLKIVYEPGVVMDGTAANAVTSTSGHEFSGSAVYYVTVFGNQVQVRNYSEATASSPNGFGNRGNNRLTVYNAHVINCDDGFSSHDSAWMTLYDCSAQGCEKSPFLHVQACKVRAYRCEFYQKVGGLLEITDSNTTADIACYDCKFIPAADGPNVQFLGTYVRCQFGTIAFRCTFATPQPVTLTDCYVHASADGTMRVALTRCYGKFSHRIRNGGDIQLTNCVWGGPTSLGGITYSNFSPGSSGVVKHRNNIYSTASAAAFMAIDATNAGYLVAANAEWFNNVLGGSAAFDADLIAADAGGTVIVGNVTGNPRIGPANTLNPDDYAVRRYDSVALGAGIGGINAGFLVGEVQAPTPLRGTVPTP